MKKPFPSGEAGRGLLPLCPPPLPISQNLLGNLLGKCRAAGILVSSPVTVLCDAVRVRSGLLLQLLSLLSDTQKCFVTLDEWGLQKRCYMRHPEQNLHCVVAHHCRGRSFPVLSLWKQHQQIICNAGGEPGRRIERGQQTIVSLWSGFLQLTVIQLNYCSRWWYSTSLLALLFQVHFGTAPIHNATSNVVSRVHCACSLHSFCRCVFRRQLCHIPNRCLLCIWGGRSTKQLLHLALGKLLDLQLPHLTLWIEGAN